MQPTATYCIAPEYTVHMRQIDCAHCNKHCNTLQHIATHLYTQYIREKSIAHTSTHTATHCQTPQRTATHLYTQYICKESIVHISTHPETHCNALQHTFMHSTCARNRSCTFQHTLKHTATHCNTLVCAVHMQGIDHAYFNTNCNTLQRTATHCNTLQHTCMRSTYARNRSRILQYILQCTAMHCNALQCTAMHCNALQRTTTQCNTLVCAVHMQGIDRTHFNTQCNTLQRTATHCNTLQHTATHLYAQYICKESIALMQHRFQKKRVPMNELFYTYVWLKSLVRVRTYVYQGIDRAHVAPVPKEGGTHEWVIPHICVSQVCCRVLQSLFVQIRIASM